ncbi:F0F1 ATP synthase subunit gamma [Candidatus Gracilibacteria bacterium]|jgi:F-type H+-transporting ATPase subunit gamma|nr:F0F1 ATP synthase subunit gamma [Candidatus Gracilibacteria bacterium]NJM88317.1 F0F1 ATP synthase subunit gamma [Hydrococcus sp. RU_2_2]NJP22257.1 F0F1 ATP synthase subunit gamma [Hydrococcus sp. CRU_1_1]
MANLKAIRDRIQSVKNTKKITEAMRLVAAAKVRRAQEQVTATRPFADALAQVLYNLLNRLQSGEVSLPLLTQRQVRTVALLVISGDRGLCGGYNTNVIRRAEQRAKELKAQGINYKFVLVGRKANQYFQRRNQPIHDKSYVGLEQIPSAAEASQIADELLSLFLSESVDRVELIYTRFVSLISSRPIVQTLLPLTFQGLEVQDDEIFRLITREGKFQVEREKVSTQMAAFPQDMIFEQDPVQILDSLLPLYLNNQLLRALQESAASELAARMTAMNNASENASDLIGTLTLSYNKARQATITQELLEVVAGANAL